MLFTLPITTLDSISDRLQYGFDLRSRYERRDDADLDSAAGDNRANLFSRGRLSMDYKAGDSAKLRVVYQFLDNRIMPVSGSETDVQGQDLVEAYLEDSSGGSTFRIGRQKVNIGNQRLIGALEWANSSRSWLGVRAQSGSWDMFWGRLALNPSPNFEAQLGLVTYKSGLGETMLAYKHDTKSAATTSVTTLNHMWSKKMGKTSLSAEGSLQFGRSGGKEHEAWAGTAKAEFGVSDSVKVFAEVNIATGGSSATKTRTFDNLYPTNHLKYGYIDRQGLRNMKSVSLGATWQMREDLSLYGAWHTFKLYDKSDGWYSASGKLNSGPGGSFIDPTGASGDDVGSEFDLVVKWKPGTNQSFAAGFSVFNAGSFVESFLTGTNTDNTWGFVQYGLKF